MVIIWISKCNELRFLALSFFLLWIRITPFLKPFLSLFKYLSQILSLNVYSLFNLPYTLPTLDFMGLFLRKKQEKKKNKGGNYGLLLLLVSFKERDAYFILFLFPSWPFLLPISLSQVIPLIIDITWH